MARTHPPARPLKRESTQAKLIAARGGLERIVAAVDHRRNRVWIRAIAKLALELSKEEE